MPIRILQQLRGAHGAYERGDLAEPPPEVAEAWVAAGVAEVVADEAAVASAPENAATRTGRSRAARVTPPTPVDPAPAAAGEAPADPSTAPDPANPDASEPPTDA